MKPELSKEKEILLMTPEEFNCSVKLASLAVELALVQGVRGSAEEFINQALDLICEAREMINERRIYV